MVFDISLAEPLDGLDLWMSEFVNHSQGSGGTHEDVGSSVIDNLGKIYFLLLANKLDRLD